MNTLKTSVVICGAGPAGLTLAHLLGQQNVDVVLVEKLANTVVEPRAITVDGESLRTLQYIGILDGFKDELLPGLKAKYVNGEGAELFEAGQPELKPYGYSTINAFDQPSLDRYLAQRLSERSSIQLLFNTTLQELVQDADGVTVHCQDQNGLPLTISADYLVGCDGGRSTVRSLLNISMQGESNPQPWLVIDTIDHHLDNTMDCQFFCDPERPGMTIRKRHGERRWEWMLMPGEDRDYLLDDSNIRKIIAPYTDASKVDIYRKRVYDFHAIIADRWQQGRVFLAGDAAHMTPPFAGQGLNSGFRDVTNISWKLSLVVKGLAAPAILDTYETERRDHAWSLIETALNLGEQIQPIDKAKAAERDAFFAAMQADPQAMQQLQDDMFSALTLRSVGQELAVGENGAAGQLLIQPMIETAEGEKLLLDELLGSGFSIVGYGCNPQAVLSSDTLADWKRFGLQVVTVTGKGQATNPQGCVDIHGELQEWLGSEEPCVLLVRPDKFCMVATAVQNADENLRKAYANLRKAHELL